jgi:hypothetical protein
MKQDYLWDKSGEDAEIAELENALAAFRYQETAPPALPSKILSFQPKTVEKIVIEKPRRRFSYAFAACAAAILITFGMMFQFSNGETAIENDLTQTFSTNEETNEEINEEDQNDLTAETETLTIENVETSPQIEISKQIIKQFEKTWTSNRKKPTTVKIRQPVSKVSDANQTFNHNHETETLPAALTDEEKHAYDQLMLALSITSSKLKIVKDKIDGVEENAVRENKR